MISKRKKFEVQHRHQLIQQFDLLRVLVARGLKMQYKRSVFGIMWSLLNPLVMLLVFTFLFKLVLNLNIPRYSSFAFSGLLVWNWFQMSLLQSASAITGSRELIRQPGFPAAILPVVTVTTNLVHFLLALPVLALLLLTGEVKLSLMLLELPFLIALQFLLTLSLAYLIATINVTFRDMQHLMGVFLTVMFYLTPVFYDASKVPAQYLPLYRLNPMTHLVEAYRAVLIQGASPDWLSLMVIGMIAVSLLVFSYKKFMRVSYRFVEEL